MTSRARVLAPLTLALLAAGWPVVAPAQSGKTVRVSLDAQQSGAQSREGVRGSGRVVIGERGGARPSGKVGVESSERRVTQTTGIFTIVQDGGESTLVVASSVPSQHVTFYRDWLTRAGMLASSVQWRDVGTSLKVRATVLPARRVRVGVTPAISWFSAEAAGVIEVTQASVELVVTSGQPVQIGGARTTLHELTREILGVGQRQSTSETRLTLTATVLD
jgi:hypothetical protein